MRKLYSILYLLLCLCITGCDDDSNEGEPTLSIVKSDITFTAAGGTGSIEVDALQAIKAESDKDWCTVAVNGKTVTLTVGMNPDISGRTALITVISEDEIQQLSCSQAGNRVPLPEKEAVTFDANGGTVKIVVESVLPYDVRTEADWINCTIEEDTLSITVPTNYVTTSRNAALTLTVGKLESQIAVEQTGIVLQPEVSELVVANGGETVRINVQSTLEFTAVSDQEWLTVTAAKNYITLEAGDNTGGTPRSATVTLNSKGIVATIDVIQKPLVYEDFLGTWVLTASNEGTPVNRTVRMEAAVQGSTYKLYGFGASDMANNYPITVNYDTETGLVFIINQDNIGTDADGNIVGFTAATADYGVITGRFISAIGQLSKGKLTWELQTVDLGTGPEPIVGIGYRYKDPAGGWHTYNVDGTLSDLVMTKGSSSANGINTAGTHFSSGRSFTTVEKAASAR